MPINSFRTARDFYEGKSLKAEVCFIGSLDHDHKDNEWFVITPDRRMIYIDSGFAGQIDAVRIAEAINAKVEAGDVW